MAGYADEDYEPGLVLVTYRVSRKLRTCEWCESVIRPGERYQRVFFPPRDGPAVTLAAHVSPAECDWDVAPHLQPEPGVLNPELLHRGSW
jgi:hypothetical protein